MRPFIILDMAGGGAVVLPIDGILSVWQCAQGKCWIRYQDGSGNGNTIEINHDLMHVAHRLAISMPEGIHYQGEVHSGTN